MRRLTPDAADVLDVLEATVGLLDDVLRDAALNVPGPCAADDHHDRSRFLGHRTALRNRAADQVNAVGRLALLVTRPERDSPGGHR